MNKALFLFVFLFGCGGVPKSHLHHNDLVKVVAGFYKGCSGVVVDTSYRYGTVVDTIVNLHCDKEDLGATDVEEYNLEKL